MVPCLCGVVVERAIGTPYDVFEVFVIKLRALYEFVEIVDIGFLVLSVMEINGLLGDCRGKGAGGIRQLWLCISHIVLILWFVGKTLRGDKKFGARRGGARIKFVKAI